MFDKTLFWGVSLMVFLDGIAFELVDLESTSPFSIWVGIILSTGDLNRKKRKEKKNSPLFCVTNPAGSWAFSGLWALAASLVLKSADSD